MANHVSSLKRARQTRKDHRQPRQPHPLPLQPPRPARSPPEGRLDGRPGAVPLPPSALDKSVQKGVIHDNTASRYKSRLNARVKALATKAA